MSINVTSVWLFSYMEIFFITLNGNKLPSSFWGAVSHITAPDTTRFGHDSTDFSTLLSILSLVMLQQKVEPVHNASLLWQLHSLAQTWVIKHFLHCLLDVIASFGSYCCSTSHNNLLVQNVVPVCNVWQLFINLQLEFANFWRYKETY